MKMILPGTGVPYVVNEWDQDLDKLAARFRTDGQRIYNLSKKKPEYQSLTYVDFSVKFKELAGKTVYVPVPLDERSWMFESFSPKEGQTIKQICEFKNADKRRTGMPKLDPPYVWKHVMNARFRQHHLFRQDLKRDDIDKDPSQQTVRKDSPELWIPYPIPDEGGHIDVKPLKEQIAELPQPKAVVTTKPDWISDLIFRLNAIEELAKKLNQLELECGLLRQQCAVRVERLVGIIELLELIDREKPPGSDVKDLKKKLAAFHEKAVDIMTINPAKLLELYSEKERLDIAKKLLESLRWDGFKALVDKALASNPHQVIDGTPLMNRICRVVEYAYQALADGYFAHEQHLDLEGAVCVVGKAKAGVPPPEAKTALASLISIAGTKEELPPPLPDSEKGDGVKVAAAAASALMPNVGNLPGPASLAGVAVKWLALRYCVLEFSNPIKSREKYKTLYKVFEVALRFTSEEQKLMQEVFDAAEDLKTATAKLEGTALGDVLAQPRQQALFEKIRTNTKKVNDNLAGRVHKSFGWRSAMFGLTIFSMYCTLSQPDPLADRFAANVIGGGAATFAASLDVAAKLFEFFGSKGYATKLNNFLTSPAAGAYFGMIGAVCTVYSGYATAKSGYHGHRNDELVGGIIQMVGGTALFVAAAAVALGYAPYSATVLVPEIIGAVSLTVSAVVLNWEEIKKYMWAGTKKLTKFHLEYFQKTDEYIKCSLKSAELKTAWTEVMTAFEAASFSDFDEKRRGKVETELTQRFGKDIDYMFTGYWTPPANPAYPKL